MTILGQIRSEMARMGIINEESIVNEDLPDLCFICSNQLVEHKCNTCSVDFNEIFICPLLNDTSLNEGIKTCNVTSQKCEIKALEYERCELYHSSNLG